MAPIYQPSHYTYPKYNEQDNEEALRAALRRYGLAEFMTATSIAFIRGLDLLDVTSSEIRCCGHTKIGARCRIAIEKNELVRAIQAVLMAACDHTLLGEELQWRLQNIAIHFLCKRWHQTDEQAMRLGDKWYGPVLNIRGKQLIAGVAPAAGELAYGARVSDVKTTSSGKECVPADVVKQEPNEEDRETMRKVLNENAQLTEENDLLKRENMSLRKEVASLREQEQEIRTKGELDCGPNEVYLDGGNARGELPGEGQEIDRDEESDDPDEEEMDDGGDCMTPTSSRSGVYGASPKSIVSTTWYRKVKRQLDEARAALDEVDETLEDLEAENNELKTALESMETPKSAGQSSKQGLSSGTRFAHVESQKSTGQNSKQGLNSSSPLSHLGGNGESAGRNSKQGLSSSSPFANFDNNGKNAPPTTEHNSAKPNVKPAVPFGFTVRKREDKQDVSPTIKVEKDTR